MLPLLRDFGVTRIVRLLAALEGMNFAQLTHHVRVFFVSSVTLCTEGLLNSHAMRKGKGGMEGT